MRTGQTGATQNAALDAAVALYDDIAAEYTAALAQASIPFAPFDEARAERAELLSRLRDVGARVRNGGASVVLGAMSQACVACTGACKSQTLEISNACHRSCYFCFNPNQEDFAYYCEHAYPWRRQLDNLAKAGERYAAIALTGGEPLLFPEETASFFRRARKHFPEAHLRLYTSGDMLTRDLLSELQHAGLDEIRFSVKLDDTESLQKKVLAKMQMAAEYIDTVMVEMPAIPGTDEAMYLLLRQLDSIGVYGINLLEFAYPMYNNEEFLSRGFTLKNPPFDVVYDYDYAGALAIQGSEELALRLMLWAHEQGLELGMHYCSLENKHRMQIRQINEPYAHISPAYAFDYDDFFLKTIQVFGQDRATVRGALRLLGCKAFSDDAEADVLSFHPEYLARVRKLCNADGHPVRFCVSTNVIQEHDGALAIRELKVRELAPDELPVQLVDATRASDEDAGYEVFGA